MPEEVFKVTLFAPEGQHDFRLSGGPLGDPSEGAEALRLLGRAAASWARLEQHIDVVLLQINRAEHSNENLCLYDPNHPRPFADKLDLLKAYFNKHPTLSAHRESIRELATRLKVLAEDRNEYLHAILEEFDETAGTVTLNSIQPVKPRVPDTFKYRRVVLPVAALVNFADNVCNANLWLLEISKTLFTKEIMAALAGK